VVYSDPLHACIPRQVQLQGSASGPKVNSLHNSVDLLTQSTSGATHPAALLEPTSLHSFSRCRTRTQRHVLEHQQRPWHSPHSQALPQHCSNKPCHSTCSNRPLPHHLPQQAPAPAAAASSGLHHDFHDNLYVLLRGRKRFRLWPPQKAPHMYTHGKLRRVHDNGRIVYAGQGPVLPDGSAAGDVSAWRKRSAAEAAVKCAEQQLAAVSRGDNVLVSGSRLTKQVGSAVCCLLLA
jgi:hypothetical protein